MALRLDGVMYLFAAHPTFIVEEDQWFTRGYAFDGAEVLGFLVDRKEQAEDVWGPTTPSDFLAGEAPAAAKDWLRTLLATP